MTPKPKHYEGFGRWNSRMCGVCWKPWPCPTKLEADKQKETR